jgi:hypothetical protein
MTLTALLAHFSIKQPADRHQAGADVEVTAQVFFQLIRAAESSRVDSAGGGGWCRSRSGPGHYVVLTLLAEQAARDQQRLRGRRVGG